jgi:hypothetical protein
VKKSSTSFNRIERFVFGVPFSDIHSFEIRRRAGRMMEWRDVPLFPYGGIKMEMLPDRELLVGSQVVRLDQLGEKFKALKEFQAHAPVLIRHSDHAKYEDIQAVMTECAKLGLRNVNIQRLEPPGEKSDGVAEAWLMKIDRKLYPDAYDKLSGLAKASASMRQWKSAMELFRKPLGVAVRRRCISIIDESSPSEGAYQVIQYETEFSAKKEAVETVIVKKDPDGVWRPAGYFIK